MSVTLFALSIVFRLDSLWCWNRYDIILVHSQWVLTTNVSNFSPSLFSIFFARRGSIHFDFRSSFLLWSSLWFSLLFPFPASFSSRFAHCFHWLPLNYLSEKEWEEENNIRQNTQSIEHNDDDSDDDKRKSKRHESAFTGKKREDAIPLTVYSLFSVLTFFPYVSRRCPNRQCIAFSIAFSFSSLFISWLVISLSPSMMLLHFLDSLGSWDSQSVRESK